MRIVLNLYALGKGNIFHLREKWNGVLNGMSLQMLRRYNGHVTAKEIHEDARKTIPNISLATVYRNLRILVQQRQIAESRDSRFPSRYEINTGNHYHIRCVRCGRMNDLPLTVLTGVEENIAESVPCETLGHHLEIIGICPECQYRSKLSASGRC